MFFLIVSFFVFFYERWRAFALFASRRIGLYTVNYFLSHILKEVGGTEGEGQGGDLKINELNDWIEGHL